MVKLPSTLCANSVVNPIKKGFTNRSFWVQSGGSEYFYQVYKSDRHNHKLNYALLKNFSFVPPAVLSNKKFLLTKYFENETLVINALFLKKAALVLKKIHTSKLRFPKFNTAQRIRYYHRIILRKHSCFPCEIKTYFFVILKILKNQPHDTPCHNDPWVNNFFYHKQRFYLCDWEYAAMNNKHFDLAYFIASSQLNKKQEKIFLSAYKNYFAKRLLENKLVVYYITLLWLWKWPEPPFPYEPILAKLNETNALLTR